MNRSHRSHATPRDPRDPQRQAAAQMTTEFVVTLRALPGVDPLTSLRAGLRVLLRRFGLRATKIATQTQPEEAEP